MRFPAQQLSDAAAVLDWMSTLYPNPSYCWVAGISFGHPLGRLGLVSGVEIAGPRTDFADKRQTGVFVGFDYSF